jgi:metacaspase-1
VANKALCVGINDYPVDGADLAGCVNDANAWADLLVTRFDFPRGSVKMLIDRRAKKKPMIDGIKSLIAGAKEGDLLVFTNSSHGSYIPDKDDDEPDSYDETLCPWDVEDDQITDDELRTVLDDIPRGVRFTFISDSCHSGSVTRARLNEVVPERRRRYRDDRRVRFLNPALIRRTRLLPNSLEKKPTGRVGTHTGMRHLLVSGCRDDEYSYDARIGGRFHGAMTYHAIKAIRAARYRITPAALVKELNKMLPAAGYDQHPQLSGQAAARRRPIFT